MKAPAQTEGNFKLAPAGTHTGYLVRIIDLGTTYNERYSKHQHKIAFGYELTSALMEPNDDGEQKPYTVMEFLTLSVNEKANLRKRIETWRGEGFANDEEAEAFEITDLLGKAGFVTVIHGKKQNGEEKAVVASVISPPDGIQLPDRMNELVLLDFENFDKNVYENLSDGLKKMIAESQEYEALFNPDSTNSAAATKAQPATTQPTTEDAGAPFDDDIPF